MADFDLNLSTQPFPAYRLTNIALICVFIGLAIVSVWQGRAFLRYSRMSASIRSMEQDNRVEAAALARRVADLRSRLDRPESSAKLNEISFLNHLILRKNLSWTKLFATLEELVPENVHLTTLSPQIAEDGTVTLRLGLRTKSIPDGTVFVKHLEESPLFKKLAVQFESRQEGTASADIELTLDAVYFPQKELQ